LHDHAQVRDQRPEARARLIDEFEDSETRPAVADGSIHDETFPSQSCVPDHGNITPAPHEMW